jgi:hypothetical protein
MVLGDFGLQDVVVGVSTRFGMNKLLFDAVLRLIPSKLVPIAFGVDEGETGLIGDFF